VTPTSQPVMEIVEPNIDLKHGKNEITSVTESPPVHEIRYQSNPYTNVVASATPTLPPVFSYTSTPTFSAPIETAGTIYHTGVSKNCEIYLTLLVKENIMRQIFFSFKFLLFIYSA
jgi:hypothetical protein